MASVLQLLSLPAHSTGFTAIADSINDTTDSSPPHKTPRLTGDSDSPSAARGSSKPNQPVRIQVIGGTERPKAQKPRPILPQSIRQLLSRESPVDATFEAIYNECFSAVCVANTGENLYGTLKLELEQAISVLCRQLLAARKTAPSTKSGHDLDVEAAEEAANWLTKFVADCQWFEEQVALSQSLFTYLDQVYVPRAAVPNIRNLAFTLFVRRIFENPELMEFLRNSVRTVVTAERYLKLGVRYSRSIPSLISHLYTHQQYTVFEEFYRDFTFEYFEKESSTLAESMKDKPKEFFAHIQTLVREEVQRSRDLLPAGSWSVMRDATVKALLGGRMSWIAETTLGDFLDSRDYQSMQAMNDLFSDTGDVKVICATFKNHIQKTVQTIVKDASADDTMVQRLLECRSIADSAIKECFQVEPVILANFKSGQAESTSVLPLKQPNRDFVYAVSDAFASGFKARRNKPAEMIAKHLDKLMRKGQGAMSDAEFHALLDTALGLYRFTEDKDVFRGFYLRALAKRLLLERSASQDFESTVLKRLQDEYDPEFSMGKEMFKDLALSRDTMAEYHNQLPMDSNERKLSVMVLKQAAWPYSKEEHKIMLPPNMQEEFDAFERFYKMKHSNRILVPQHSVGTVTMTGHFKDGKKELSVSLYQAVILLLFNRSTELSFSEIIQEVGMLASTLRVTLQSLACGKKRVLLKEPAGRDINDNDVFRFNDAFTDPRAKVHINSIQVKISVGYCPAARRLLTLTFRYQTEESQQTQAAIDTERMYTLDAAIVRIMKAKKEFKYQPLLSETTNAVIKHFTPDVKDIKARIDHLIEAEYIRRDDDRPDLIVYVA
ncbi:CULLIN-2 domain-containing protein [Favolaschia claudopus]|uniref:CULLIN-2 domain-containing protein n=1 Tax=Favolaschia claudopus TaxID=2862362 RepID=A0AAW0EII8_9AGAR